MTVRAKFFVKTKTYHHNGNPEADQSAEIKLAPVFGVNDHDANRIWSKYTPSGEITMLITNPTAIDQFDIGGEYYVDFTKADET